jgi:hypothetical protein
MHEHHKGHDHHHDHDHDHGREGAETLRKLLAMLDHWIDHGDSHIENYREWATQAVGAGEDEIAREIGLAVDGSGAVKEHLKRARAIAAAKLVLKK